MLNNKTKCKFNYNRKELIKVSNYFVALKFPAGGSLGFNIEADNENNAFRKVVSSLSSDLIDLGIKDYIIIPQARIDCNFLQKENHVKM